MIAFLDVTALAALYAGGPCEAQVRAAVAGEESLAIALVSKVHMAALLDDLRTAGAGEASVERIGRQFLDDEADFVKVPTDALVMESMILAVRHHIGADRAQQLAGALHLERRILRQAGFLLQPVVLVTLDPDLAAAARTEGLRTAP